MAKPRRLNLDRRAEDIASAAGDPDDLLTTRQLADWLGVSTQWVDGARAHPWGPPFIRVGPRFIRYVREDVIKWLRARPAKRRAA